MKKRESAAGDTSQEAEGERLRVINRGEVTHALSENIRGPDEQ